ncbi:MAG: hypothetical protein LBT57_01940 [Puniceicoccales bacterium]|nr:hypothetical protein [Puniceicoccales bacterium]
MDYPPEGALRAGACTPLALKKAEEQRLALDPSLSSEPLRYRPEAQDDLGQEEALMAEVARRSRRRVRDAQQIAFGSESQPKKLPHPGRIGGRRLSRKSLYTKTFCDRLKPNLIRITQQCMLNGFSGLIDVIVNKIENEGGLKELSRGEFLLAHLKHEETFAYVRRMDRPENEQMALYTYADAVLASDDGWFNKIKRDVLDAMMPYVEIYNALVQLCSPTDRIEETHFLAYLEAYLDPIFDTLLPKITNAVFSLVSDTLHPQGCTLFGKSKLSYSERVQLASGAVDVLKGIFKKILNEDIVEGISGIVGVLIPRMMNEPVRRAAEPSDTGHIPVPSFRED